MNTEESVNFEVNESGLEITVKLDLNTGEIVVTTETWRTRIVIEHGAETTEIRLAGLGALGLLPDTVREQFPIGSEMSRFNGAAID